MRTDADAARKLADLAFQVADRVRPGESSGSAARREG